MKKQIIFLLLTLVLTGYELNAQHQHHHGTERKPTGASAAATDPAFQKQLAAVFTSSQALNEALIASDAAKTKTAATAVLKALALTEPGLLKGQPAAKNWLDYQQPLKTSLDRISKTNDLDQQRQAFAQFSETLYQSIKAFGLGGTQAYYQHCPMALNDTGGFWLSNSKTVRNPYFGHQMLGCGSTKETLN